LIRPVCSAAEIDRLSTAEGASRVEIRIGRSKVDALRPKSGRLAKLLHRAGQAYGDIDVTMIITIPRGKTRHQDRQELLADVRDLEDIMPGIAEKARAKLVYAEGAGSDHAHLTELVEHHITAKRRVPAVNDKGESVQISSAVDVILAVAREHEDELRRVVAVED
jgi:hypothetical protein